MMQDNGNTLDAKTDNLQQTLSKEIQDLKLKQAEMQNTITKKKKTKTKTKAKHQKQPTAEYRRQKNE